MLSQDSFYKYALNKDGHIVHISEVNEGNRHDGYRCVSCGCELTPVLGKKNAHHFRHKTDACSYESYIHKLWKQYIFEQWPSIKHLYVSYVIEHTCAKASTCKLRTLMRTLKCNNSYNKETIDLRALYDTCEMEGSYGGYRADILLKSSKNPDTKPAFIEICYKHPCEESKQNSGIKIVELKVTNDNLDLPQKLYEDYTIFPGLGHKPLGNMDIVTYGFNRTREISQKIRRFCVYQDENGINHGKVDNVLLSCHDTDKHCPDSMMEIFVPEEVLASQNSFLELGIKLAANNNLAIKHCIRCKFRGNRGKTCLTIINSDKESWLVNINDLSDIELDKTNYSIFKCKYYRENPLMNNERRIDDLPHIIWRNTSYVRKPCTRPNIIKIDFKDEKLTKIALRHSISTK